MLSVDIRLHTGAVLLAQLKSVYMIHLFLGLAEVLAVAHIGAEAMVCRICHPFARAR